MYSARDWVSYEHGSFTYRVERVPQAYFARALNWSRDRQTMVMQDIVFRHQIAASRTEERGVGPDGELMWLERTSCQGDQGYTLADPARLLQRAKRFRACPPWASPSGTPAVHCRGYPDPLTNSRACACAPQMNLLQCRENGMWPVLISRQETSLSMLMGIVDLSPNPPWLDKHDDLVCVRCVLNVCHSYMMMYHPEPVVPRSIRVHWALDETDWERVTMEQMHKMESALF